MREIVLDTNVLVSGLISSRRAPGRILDALRKNAIRLTLDDRIFAEYQIVLSRPYFERYFTLSERERILDFIYYDSNFVICEKVVKGLPDLSDVPFLETALTANVPLVTGNLKHFPKSRCQGALVLDPSGFISKYL